MESPCLPAVPQIRWSFRIEGTGGRGDNPRPSVHEDVDAGVGDAVEPERSHDPPRRVPRIPGFHPDPDALLKVGDDLVGDARVNILSLDLVRRQMFAASQAGAGRAGKVVQAGEFSVAVKEMLGYSIRHGRHDGLR
jgi:hypothetical protein